MISKSDGHFRKRVAPESATGAAPLYLGLKTGKNYGWGVCGDYLTRELSQLRTVRPLPEAGDSLATADLPGPLFQALTDKNFTPLYPKARGTANVGYTFFEFELTPQSLKNAADFDLVLAGSTWCRERMLAAGISNSGVLLQGIDPALFYPIETQKAAETFVLFSGGKFEYRKGQDLVLKAVSILQKKYTNLFLVTCWYNMWPETMKTMNASAHIRFDYDPGRSWHENMNLLYEANGLDASRVITLGLTPNAHLRRLYKQTDLGIFPNRCEGGTNLVMMEYMACAKPVIASYTSGHKDILTHGNSLQLQALSEHAIIDEQKQLIARWEDPSLDELVAKIEYAYLKRDEIRRTGLRAGADMEQYTWEKTAKRLLGYVDALPKESKSPRTASS